MKRLDKLKPKEIFGRLRNSFNKKARRRRNDHEVEPYKELIFYFFIIVRFPGNIDVGDGCWRQFVLITILR